MMFSEEVAWVTGSSTGIGAASAVALAGESCRVAVHYNRSEDEAGEVVGRICSSGGEAMLVGGGGPGAVAYASAKGGVSTLTRAMAKELVSENILVNGVAPGVITTPFHERFTPPEVRERMTAGIPIGREGTPEEVAGAVVFLASPAADYLVGEIIEVNGGQLMS